MNAITPYLWLIPALPLAAAGGIALLRQRRKTLAAGLAVGSIGLSLILSFIAFWTTLGGASQGHGGPAHDTSRFVWFALGPTNLELGWVLDPLAASMLVMVTLVGLLIFVYSVGYMAHDENFTRFFSFLALFAAAMLGLVIANNLLLLFICWELVGLTSYLLIGFWFHKPSAAAAAKKAFLTTRVGDIGFLLAIVWLYAQTGTLQFYDDGAGCLEHSALTRLVTQTTTGGLGVATAISLLLFCGAIGKSGQFPLHVWLPDAMEGPTPVSALIHAATMVAAGVFLVARVYPLMAVHPDGAAEATTALQAVTWVGALTAVFAASIAVAQTDIKRILAYSTVSQLGFMMMGLGVGGVAVGMFHLITHAFFKALLFLGAGSVIHGVHEEQDIRRMGGLRRWMPVTFATYGVGMMALAGVPLFFSGFWSKDAILHAAHGWTVSAAPFYLGLCGALLTAFYMTRQVCYVFGGAYRGGAGRAATAHASRRDTPHESPAVMTAPLIV
ncbi:MAG: NADH-quinone oxidoreductase subunit L, partial [Verrucomicrobia bacterium]|nr:NADH-quinone oxidoreductase subunit L [Verrucomicrobiota bacterium]